ncbi:hypothetical protein [Neobacillus mesonae]|uniref:Uncharacterized protein n=1 Tax=Neobacillus mesonae TaxID=1193713 RepID=A0A3T0HVR5_9BACI|nr:hypothetical protein [Neobacillus mesonae]AZU61058.1 hypothetical protein CHR53_07210 [Neobacillus mesonae]
MLTLLLSIIAGYLALGVVVTAVLNYGLVGPGYRLEKLRQSIPLVLGWPIVIYVFVAVYSDMKR